MAHTQERDVQVVALSDRLSLIRSRTLERLKFEIEYARKKGTTANSYLLEQEKTILIDPPGESFTDLFLEQLQQKINLTDLDWIILGHINANRAATLKSILAVAPEVKIICSNPAVLVLQDLLPDRDLNLEVIKTATTLDVGNGHSLELIPTPNPRFPDQLCTYSAGDRVLFSDKLFGAHVCSDEVFEESTATYADDRRYYFDCVVAPYWRQINPHLETLLTYDIEIYAPNHGPLVRYGGKDLINSYQQWLTAQQEAKDSVALVYASAYGNTTTLAQAIARGLTKAGIRVESINAEVATPEEIKTAIEECQGFIFGSPTLGGHAPTPIQTALGITLNTADKTKLAGVFGSFGWSGEAIDLLESKFKDGGYTLGFEPIRVKFAPTDAVLQMCEEAGTDFAQTIKKNQLKRQGRSSIKDSNVDRLNQALGRIVGSLGVVTTKQDEVSGGMLASWIAQATFTPPGLTVAIAKDRAIESLLYTGSSFNLNLLQQGNHLGLMKHFLKPFAPGEDRFADIPHEFGENGCPILTEALSYLECEIQQRMECGDHWVVYAEVKAGQLLQDAGLTAIHHRKSGTHY